MAKFYQYGYVDNIFGMIKDSLKSYANCHLTILIVTYF